jgi:hypothetical protein
MGIENYYRRFADVLKGEGEKDRFPTRKDLEKIYIDKEASSNVQSFLRDHRHCLVEGAERRGKTTLARFVGLQYLDSRFVARIDVSRISDTSDLAPFKQMLKGGVLDRSDVLIIIEDCHTKSEVTTELLNTVKACQEASFLFTMRSVGKGERIPVDDPFEDSEIRQQGWVVRLDGNEEAILRNIKGIVDKFVQINKSELKREWAKADPTSEDYLYLVSQTSGNKQILKYYLEAWRDTEDPDLLLRNTDRRRVLEKFSKERLKGLDSAQLEVLKSMAVLGQFEIPVLIRFLFTEDFIPAAQQVASLKERGLAFKLSLEQDEWLLADTEARFTLEYLKASDSFVRNILGMYVRQAPNYFEVFHSLHRARERDLLISLVQDAEVFDSLVWQLAKSETPLNGTLYVLRAVGWADKAKGHDLWREYRKAIGERFLDEVKRKLVEFQSINLAVGLLKFLSTIDREGEAIPLAEALPAELLTSQARSEFTPFVSLFNSVRLLSVLAPEKAKQMLTSLDESDYRRLGEEAKHKNIQYVMWFLRLLAIHTELKAATEAFLDGLGLEGLVEMITSPPFSVGLGIIQWINAVAPEKASAVMNGFTCSDYIRLGEKARKSNLQKVYWFLRLLADHEELKKFADCFLNGIGHDILIKMADSSPISTVMPLRKVLGRLNTDTATKIRKNLEPTLSEEEWTERWADETVGPQSRVLWAWTCSLEPQSRVRGKNLAKRLANADTILHFEQNKASAPVRQLGRLLSGAYYADKEAAKCLALKALESFDARSMRSSPQDLALLLRNVRRCNRDAAQQLAIKVLNVDATSLSSKGELNWFCQLLWEAVLSNESRTKDWVSDVEATFWEDLAVKNPPAEAFRLLLVLWQTNRELGISVTYAVGQRLIKSQELMDNLQAMPLLGLFVLCGLKPRIALSFSGGENIEGLHLYPASQRQACSLFYLQESKPEEIAGFIEAILTRKPMTTQMALLLAEHRLPWTASDVEGILVSAKSEIIKEREDIYDRMLLLFRAIRLSTIYVGTMLGAMCAPQFAQHRELISETKSDTEEEEKRTRTWATIWLASAIDKGIFSMQMTEHPITHKASRVLSLNMHHPQVTSAFAISESLLLALYDAQIDKGWADSSTWDTAFRGSWKAGSLPQQELRYWQEILLKMNLVYVECREIGKGDFTIVFSVNVDHGLVKSLLQGNRLST